MLHLANRIALVTGGGRGIGRAIALALADAGADVAISYQGNQQAADETADAIRKTGRRCLAIAGDVSQAAHAQELGDIIERQWGGLDILVNNAGFHKRVAFLEMPLEVWNKVVEVDLTGSFLVSQASAKRMATRGYGKIINITSIFASRGASGLAHYCAAKGGLEALTRALAVELAPAGIRVNAIAPGLVRTDLTAPIMNDSDLLQKRVAEMPLGGPLKVNDLVGTAVFLASGASDMITGVTIPVDAGASAR